MKPDPRNKKSVRNARYRSGGNRPPPDAARIRELVEGAVASCGAETLELSIGRNRVVRLVVDRDPGAVETELLVRVLQGIRRRMSEGGFDPGDFQLEVDSPGEHRLLRTARHFERFKGAQVRIQRGFGRKAERERALLLGVREDQPFIRDQEGYERVLLPEEYDEIRLVSAAPDR